jgi:hypothetical protein
LSAAASGSPDPASSGDSYERWLSPGHSCAGRVAPQLTESVPHLLRSADRQRLGDAPGRSASATRHYPPIFVEDAPLTDAELSELERLIAAASPAPWEAMSGPAIGGPDFIRLGGFDDSQPDMYVDHDGRPAPVAELDFIAAARNHLPRLIAEIRRCRRD